MNFKVIIFALSLLSLSACISTPNLSGSGGSPEPESGVIVDPPAAEENTDAAVNQVILADLERVPAQEHSTTIEPDATIEPIDLFERLRRGFEFPNLESKYISDQEHWNSTHNTYLKGLFNRATPFLYHIVEELDKRGLPMELALLPAIESAYKPEALSRSKAGGLWQFIPATGRYFGLRQDWWYDGRQDALASTKAALDYLTSLNKTFEGDWFLTLAAYNAGPGTVSRAIKANKARGKGTRYQDLKLRLETRRYVPKLIALKNIINNPEKFNVKLPYLASRPYFKIVNLNGQIDLKKFAEDAGIDDDDLRHLNAGFKRWATSPDGPHRLLIPLNADGNVDHAEVAIKRAPTINYKNHRIVEGDSLSRIARRYGVSVSAIQKSNNLTNTKIRAGRNLLIPVRNSAFVKASYTPSVDSIDSPSSVASSRSIKSHQVKRGDTLWSIARQYKVKIKNLLTWNKISADQILSVNQMIRVVAD